MSLLRPLRDAAPLLAGQPLTAAAPAPATAAAASHDTPFAPAMLLFFGARQLNPDPRNF